ncbi:hypothetical protein Tco_0620105, partial [Tanacetum coccineum]
EQSLQLKTCDIQAFGAPLIYSKSQTLEKMKLRFNIVKMASSMITLSNDNSVTFPNEQMLNGRGFRVAIEL